MSNIGQQLLDVPFSDMVAGLACAIAESQAKLDMESIEVLKMMGDKTNNPVELPYIGKTVTTSMIGAGFQPTFYQFSETIIEVKMTISMSQESKVEGNSTSSKPKTSILRKQPVSLKASSLNAKYTNTYNFSQEGSSLIRTTIVPVPPNPVILSIIEQNANKFMEDLEDEI